MAFWGTKVNAGKPYTLVYNESTGAIGGARQRLRITQATLAKTNYSKTSERSILECRVGSRKPVIVCSLVPNRQDSISLDLEFQEKEAVVFYVRGSIAIHLVGYIPANPHEEEIGEDIHETESDRSEQLEDSDDLSDFIVDDDAVEYNSTASSDEGTWNSKKRMRKSSKSDPNFSKKKKTKKVKKKESESDDEFKVVESFFS